MALCNVIEMMINLDQLSINCLESEGCYKLRVSVSCGEDGQAAGLARTVLPFLTFRTVVRSLDGSSEDPRPSKVSIRVNAIVVERLDISYSAGGANCCKIQEMMCFSLNVPCSPIDTVEHVQINFELFVQVVLVAAD